MSDIVIKAEDIGKLYKLGEIGTGTISHDLNRWWAKMRGKEDPFAKVGQTNDRTTKSRSDWVWALKDVNFEVKQGEVLGIIGRNGAGKSTLLKILSKVTTPSTGRIKTKGRIASLLEVGTGFHQELTGRENIFLNGAILGMSKAEIRSKFDEIVDFAGVERYIDTPVKRYSSGMYVRLAFAVAAFLEPEILIIDEVLAVGDAEFQKKCLGRMKDVSVNDGRTVLFVSHNMAAIKTLCNKGLYMEYGMVKLTGTADEAVLYYNNCQKNLNFFDYDGDINKSIGNQHIKILKFNIIASEGSIITVKSGFKIDIEFLNLVEKVNLDVSVVLKNYDEVVLLGKAFMLSQNMDSKKGVFSLSVEFPGDLINEGNYYFRIFFGANARDVLYSCEEFGFEVMNNEDEGNFQSSPGIIKPRLTSSSVFKTAEYNGKN
jgi:lipopolysaccharide transport system ATP-binding protein